jgi:hypothetical protein
MSANTTDADAIDHETRNTCRRCQVLVKPRILRRRFCCVAFGSF